MLSPNWPKISSAGVVLLTITESFIRDSGIEVINLEIKIEPYLYVSEFRSTIY
jgi:hypothetical protein